MKYRFLWVLILPIMILIAAACKNSSNTVTKSATPEKVEVKHDVRQNNLSFHEAALNGLTGQVTAMLAEGFNVDTLDQDGRTPLMYASYNGHNEIIGKLIRNGASVNFQDNYGRSALMMASSGPYPMAVKLLLDQSADPNLVDKEEHFTAIMFAAAEGQLESVKLLLSFKADPGMKDIDGDDALTFARNNGHSSVVSLLQSIKK